MNDVLLLVRTSLRRYAVRRSDLVGMRTVADPAELQPADGGRPLIARELDALLEGVDRAEQRRRHALIVSMRRRNVALLVDAVEDLLERPVVQPLPALLRRHLREEWATGALLVGEEVVVQLDLRAVARSVLHRMSTVVRSDT